MHRTTPLHDAAACGHFNVVKQLLNFFMAMEEKTPTLDADAVDVLGPGYDSDAVKQAKIGKFLC